MKAIFVKANTAVPASAARFIAGLLEHQRLMKLNAGVV